MLPSLPSPVLHHPRLRESESREGANGEQGNEAIGDPTEEPQQRAGEGEKDENARGVHEPAAGVTEKMRQKLVFGQNVGKRGTGRSLQDEAGSQAPVSHLFRIP